MPPCISEGKITFFSKESGFTSYIAKPYPAENAPLIVCVGSHFQPRKGTRNQAELVYDEPPCYGVSLDMLLDNWEQDDAFMQLAKRHLREGRKVIVQLDPDDPATSISARIVLECMLLDSSIESCIQRMKHDFARERFRFQLTDAYPPARLPDVIRILRKKEEMRAVWNGLVAGRSLRDAETLYGSMKSP